MPEVPRGAGEAPPRWRREARALAELFTLCGFAITFPLLDVFGRGVEQFAFRGASKLQIVAFGVGVTVVPAVVLWLAEVSVVVVEGLKLRASRVVALVTPDEDEEYVYGPARHVAHVAILGALVAAFAIQALRPLVTGLPLGLLAVVAGGVGIVAYVRTRAARLWLAFAAPAPLVFLGAFLLTSPTADLLTEGRDTRALEGVEVERPAPVVMLVLDELPLASLLTTEGSIDAGLFPNLAALAEDSHWFRNTTTVNPNTWHALPAILTGQMPEDGEGPVAEDHPENLFTLLGGSYDLHVTETIARLCSQWLCPPTQGSGEVLGGLRDDAWDVMASRLDLDRSSDDPTAGFAEVPEPPDDPVGAAVQPERFRSLLDGLDGAPGTLSYAHLLLPHQPFQLLPSGVVYDIPDPDIGRTVGPDYDLWTDQEWPVTLARQRHLLQLQYADGLVGSLLEELHAREIYDDALIVLVADHGIGFEPEGPVRAVEGQPLDDRTRADLLWVPFFLKQPGQADGTVSDANVLTVDVLPTIAEVLGADLPFDVDGRSALGPPRATDDKPYYGSDSDPDGVALLDPVTFDGVAGWPSVLARSVGAFLPGEGGAERIWRVGPSPELLGERVEDLPGERLAGVEETLEDPDAYQDVPESGSVPALVRGHLEAAEPGAPLAVAINGTIAATGLAFRDDAGVAFAVIVDDRLLPPGTNRVRVYEIVDQP